MPPRKLMFRNGEVVHDADLGLGIIRDGWFDPEGEAVYHVEGVTGESEERDWIGKEGLLSRVTRRHVEERWETPALSADQLREAARLLDHASSNGTDLGGLVAGLRRMAAEQEELTR